jgi:Na+/melibiose symporter-like transporter
VATTLVGIASDKLNTPCGKRMPWFMMGTLLVGPTFMGIFFYPNFVENFSDESKLAWYIALPALFNVGWASV